MLYVVVPSLKLFDYFGFDSCKLHISFLNMSKFFISNPILANYTLGF